MAKREKRKISFNEDFISLVKEMDSARKTLDGLPVEQEFTMEDIDVIDDIRYSAMYLAEVAKAFIDEFQGKPKQRNDQS